MRSARNRLSFAACAILALVGLALAEDWPGAPNRAVSHVTVEPVSPVVLRAGKVTRAEVRLRVMPGFHINSSTPTSDLLIPTRLEIAPIPQVRVGKPAYPAGKDFVFKAAQDEKLNVYAGAVSIAVPLTPAKPLRAGEYRLQAELKYQACDDRSCFPPQTVRLELPVVVQPAK